jgi:hypothetical protein
MKSTTTADFGNRFDDVISAIHHVMGNAIVVAYGELGAVYTAGPGKVKRR